MDMPVVSKSRAAFPRTLLCWLILLIIIKLVLSSHEEMQGSYSPHDDLWQVWAAERSYWGGDGHANFLYHLPVYPLFIKLVSVTGVPFRVAMELTYCAAASLLSLALWRIGFPSAVAGFAAMAAILHPASFQQPNRFGAEILLSPLLMFALAGSLEWWVARQRGSSWKWAFFAALFWALAWNVRKEAVVLLPIFAIMAFCLWRADRSEGWKCVRHRMMLGAGLPLATCLVLSTAFKTINYCHWGLFANSVLTAPGYKAAFKALQRISPSQPIDYMPVTVEARRYAYEESPSFKKIKPQLEGNIGKGWAIFSKEFTDSKGLGALDPLEVSAGWFYWDLYESALKACHTSSPAKADLLFAQIAKEINKALAEGRLPGRFVPIAMIDPDFSRWLPRLGVSLHAVYNAFISPAVTVRPSRDQPFLSPQIIGLFDDLANRRAYVLKLGPGEVIGWIQAPQDNIASLGLRFSNGSPVAASLATTPRLDAGPTALGFSFIVPSHFQKKWKKMRLVATLKSGGEVEWLIGNLMAGKVEHVDSDSQSIALACDYIKAPCDSAIWRVQAQWERSYYALVRWIQWLALTGIVLAVISSLRQRRVAEILVVALFSTAVAARLFLFAILDACAWSGDQPRYLFAVMPLYGMLLVMGVWLLFREGASYLKARRN